MTRSVDARPTAALAALAVIVQAGCVLDSRPAELAAAEASLVVPFTDQRPDTLALRVGHGHVLIESGPELRCRVETEVVAASADEARLRADQVEVRRRDLDDRVELAVRPPTATPLGDVNVRWHVSVPDDVALEIRSDSADVTVRGYAGDLVVRTARGRILVDLAGGRVDLCTRSGALRLTGNYHTARVATHDGRLSIRIPDGRVVGARIDVTTASGDVRVEADARARVAIDFATESGIVTSELPFDWSPENRQRGRCGVRYRGTLGVERDGAIADVAVRVLSASGDLHLDRRPGHDSARRPTIARNH